MNNPVQFEVLTDKQYRPMQGDYIIRLALRMYISDLAETLPLNLCLLIDCSGSMMGDKIEKAREAAQSMVSALRQEDLLTVITFSTDAETLIDSQPMTPDAQDAALNTISAIRIQGITRMDSGLIAAYTSLEKNKGNYMPILLMLSDGAPTDSYGNMLDEAGREKLYHTISAAFKANGITSSTVGLGQAEHCLAPFLEKCGEKGGGVFYHAPSAQDLLDQFMEELKRVKATAISDVKFILSDMAGHIRKAAAVYPDVRVLDPPATRHDRFQLEGGALQKGEEHAFLVEIVTPSFDGGSPKKPLCQVRAEYTMEDAMHQSDTQPPLIEYTDDENLIRKAGHPEVEKYKAMYMSFVQTQKAFQNIRNGDDPKKTQTLLKSAAKTTKRLGLSKQTKLLEELSDKVAGQSVTEDDITKTSVSSRKTKVLGQ